MPDATPRRRRNPEQTRAALVESALTLASGGHGYPTAREIAAHAGTSERSVYVHFPNLDDLRVAVGEVQAERVRALVAPIESAQPLPERIAAAVEQSMDIYRLQRHVRPAGLVAAARIPAVDASMAATEDRIGSNWARTFSPEIERSTDAGLLDAIDTVLAWSTIFHLLERRHLPESACTAICTRMLTALVQAPGGRR